MKSRPIKNRSEYFYAELRGDSSYNGMILKFTKNIKDRCIKGVVVKSTSYNHPIGCSYGVWTNPFFDKISWKIVEFNEKQSL